MSSWSNPDVSRSRQLDELPSTVTASTTEGLLRRISTAPSQLQNPLFDQLLETSTPEEVVNAAFRVYDLTYRENVVLLAAALRERFGSEAWTALRVDSGSERAESEHFIRLIVECPDVSEEERVSAMQDLARNPHAEVRAGVLEYASRLSPESQVAIARLLQGDLDDEIREEARELLEH